LGETDTLWYRRGFELPKAEPGTRWLLHFGAADWETTVWINGKKMGTHRGGYTPFTFEVTKALKPSATQKIQVSTWDPTDSGHQPRGKQVKNPKGIWYTPSSGIWRTVWLEPVPPVFIESLKIVPDVDQGAVHVQASISGPVGQTKVRAVAYATRGEVASAEARPSAKLVLAIPDAKLWSPDTPFLYGLKVTLLQGDRVTDEVEGYFGMRKISVGKDQHGVMRMLLNGQPLFQLGLLDQGFWPDGLYTAPTDEALRYDIEVTRRLGFNMARKHVKVEPARWYYWCDKLGLLVWQDMPSGDLGTRDGQKGKERSKESAANFEQELKEVLEAYANHPSIVMWVPFNEGWGQYDTARIVALIRKLDPTRLVDCASGWTDVPETGQVRDVHAYPGPAAPEPEPNRALVLGEFGGLGLPVKGHTWQAEKNWGYRSFTDADALTRAYIDLIEKLRPLTRTPGLSAAVYTQTTDVEVEVNGIMTYDRARIKMDPERIAAANRRMYLPPPEIKVITPTSQRDGLQWRYTTTAPATGWYEPDFDDAAWQVGPGGFGREGTPGAKVRTAWTTSDIWLRRTFTLEAVNTRNLQLMMHHDEAAEVYLNGKLALKTEGYTRGYGIFSLTAEGRKALRKGANTFAVHCHQTQGGQYIDLGLVDVIDGAPPR